MVKNTFAYILANQMVKSDSNHYVYDGYNRRIKTVDSKVSAIAYT